MEVRAHDGNGKHSAVRLFRDAAGRLIGETVGILIGWIVERRVKKRDSRQDKGN